jgi:hypothetical protein
LRIGTDWVNGLYQPSNGEVDEVVVWDRALTSTEILQNYTNGMNGIETSLDPHIVGLWHFDEDYGHVAFDSSGNKNDGILKPNPPGPDWTTGQVGGALNFNGVNDYVDLGDETNLDLSGTITVEAWIKTTRSYYQIVYSKYAGSSTTRSPSAGLSPDGYGRFLIGIEPAIRLSSTPVNDGNWHHIAYVFIPSTNMDIYVDGVLSNGALTGTIPSSIPHSTAEPRIGSVANGGDPFEGFMDEVAIWDKALTPDDILLHYTNGLIGKGYLDVSADDAIKDLFEDIQNEELPQGSETSLLSKLNAALEALDNGNNASAINILNAFINAVEAQSGKKLTEGQAAELVAAAKAILGKINGS